VFPIRAKLGALTRKHETSLEAEQVNGRARRSLHVSYFMPCCATSSKREFTLAERGTPPPEVALVVWPASAELELVLQDGLEWALRVLRQLIADGEVPRATRLAKMMVDSCPPAVRHTRSAPATCSPSSGTRS
jgi:hypothetical protein